MRLEIVEGPGNVIGLSQPSTDKPRQSHARTTVLLDHSHTRFRQLPLLLVRLLSRRQSGEFHADLLDLGFVYADLY